MKATNVRLALVSFLFYVSAVCAQQPSSPNAQTDLAAGPSTAAVQETGHTLLTSNEITQLYQQNTPPVPLRDMLSNQCDFGTEECAVKPNQRLFNSWLFVFKP